MNHSNLPIVNHISDFLEYCEVEKGLSPISAKNYHDFLKMFIRWLKDNRLDGLRPHELTEKHVWDYRLHLSHQKSYKGDFIKKTTQSYYLRALRNLLGYFADKGITSLPLEKVKLPKLTDKDKRIKFLNFEQVKKLLDAPDVKTKNGLRDRAILEILFSTGLRVSELTSLNLNSFQFLITGKNPTEVKELVIAGKGGSVRPVYLSPRALKWLAEYLKTRKDMLSPLFINDRPDHEPNDNHRLSARYIETMVKKYTAMANLPVEATPHTLRHSYATDLLEQGADLRSVQELLGHKNIGTTQIYTHVTNRQLKKIHQSFHSGEKTD